MNRLLTEEELKTVDKARSTASALHAGQRYGQVPYIEHLTHTVNILAICGHTDVETLCIGWLHDVLEDTATTSEFLRAAGYSEAVVNGIDFCTDPESGKHLNRKERKRLTYARQRDLILENKPGVKKGVVVKVADRIANMMAGGKLRMYQREAEDFYHTLYIPGLCDELWKLFDQVCAQGNTPRNNSPT